MFAPLDDDIFFFAKGNHGPGERDKKAYSLLINVLAARVLIGPIIARELVSNFGREIESWVMGAFHLVLHYRARVPSRPS